MELLCGDSSCLSIPIDREKAQKGLKRKHHGGVGKLSTVCKLAIVTCNFGHATPSATKSYDTG